MQKNVIFWIFITKLLPTNVLKEKLCRQMCILHSIIHHELIFNFEVSKCFCWHNISLEAKISHTYLFKQNSNDEMQFIFGLFLSFWLFQTGLELKENLASGAPWAYPYPYPYDPSLGPYAFNGWDFYATSKL